MTTDTSIDASTSKVWFIAGATSGFGRIWAEAALECGDRVVATGRDITRLAELDRFGDAVLTLRLDITDRNDVVEAVRRAVTRFGRLDVVVNNAGYGHWGMVEELTEPELRDQMETNFFGAVWVAQAVLPVLREQRAGHLIQVTSEGGVRAFPGIGAYHASKWAVEGLTESLAREVEVFGVNITCLEPGPYATGFADAIRSSAPLPAYAESRAADTTVFEIGDPRATTQPLLQLVDADRPPRRLILGAVFDQVIEAHEQRVATWREWEPVSLAADQKAASS